MTFIIKNKHTSTITNPKLLKLRAYRNARFVILSFPMFADDYQMENILLEKYHTSLKRACLYLLTKCKFNTNSNLEIVVSFPNKKDELLAKFITYGDLRTRGSKILQLAFA